MIELKTMLEITYWSRYFCLISFLITKDFLFCADSSVFWTIIVNNFSGLHESLRSCDLLLMFGISVKGRILNSNRRQGTLCLDTSWLWLVEADLC